MFVFKSSSCRMFAFPVYPQIIFLIISAQPSNTDPVERMSFLDLYSFMVILIE